jgi:hypothetical protein
MTSRSNYTGEWRRLSNLSAETAGVVHNEAVARAMGFEAAVIPGNTVAQAAMPAVVDAFGIDWMRSGWYTFKFVAPVYAHDEVRESAEKSGDNISITVETRDGRTCSVGKAGLGTRPPWEQLPSPNTDESVLPTLAIGSACGERSVTMTRESVATALSAAGDSTPWYGESSPLGSPLVPPEQFVSLGLQITADCGLSPTVQLEGIRPPWMWTEHSAVVLQPPMLDQPYTMSQRIVDKGRSRKTVYLTLEFEVLDSAGVAAVVARHTVKWFAEDAQHD